MLVTNHVRHPVLTFDALALVRLGFFGAGATEKTPVPGMCASNGIIGFDMRTKESLSDKSSCEIERSLMTAVRTETPVKRWERALGYGNAGAKTGYAPSIITLLGNAHYISQGGRIGQKRADAPLGRR